MPHIVLHGLIDQKALQGVDRQSHLRPVHVLAMNPLRGPVTWAKNRLVQWGVTISDVIYTANSLHLDGKMLVRLQEDCEVPNYAL